MALLTATINRIFFIILVTIFSVLLRDSIQQTRINKHDKFGLFDDHARQRRDNTVFPVLSNISIVDFLSSNDGKENKPEGNFQNIGKLLEKKMAKEVNEEFEQIERNTELKMQTPYGNSGRNYNGDEYSRNIAYLINKISDILRKAETRNLQDITVEEREAERKEENSDAVSALSGFYTECLLRLSFPCMQRKMLVYVDALDRNNFRILGDYMSVVRIAKPPTRPIMTEESLLEPRMNAGDSIWALDSLLDYSIKRLFFTHAVRVTMPSWLSVGAPGTHQASRFGNAINFTIATNGVQEGKRYLSTYVSFNSKCVYYSYYTECDRTEVCASVELTQKP
jgi:hypothetical protein